MQGGLPPNHATLTPLKYGATLMCEARNVPDEAYYDGRVAAEAVKRIKELKTDEPFFLAVGFWKPHAPFNAPKKYWDLYDRAKLPPLNPARPEGAPEIAFHKSNEILGREKNHFTPTPEQAAEMRHGYFANISYLDAQLGKVLDALEQHPAGKHTIITFIGDHGYHIGEHSLWGKTSNFDYDAHVPMFISVPGKPSSGQTTGALAELVDLFPTLTDLCDLPTPPKLEGTSLAPLLDKPTLVLDTAAFTQHSRPPYYDREPSKTPSHMGYSVRTARVRYPEWRDWKTGEPTARELYDHQNDPQELKNAIDSPALAPEQAEAVRLLNRQFPKQTR